jgi:serine/threonine protein kinase
MEPLSANDPQVVGEFQLRARLGAGGMGRVYLAYSRAGRAVAVKVIHPQLAQDPEFRRRFDREVAAARAVSGMYTAPVVGAGLDDDPPWLATAFVPGPSLSDVVTRYGALPISATWRLAAGLAEALSAVHACGLVHRDLKPANVLLAADGPHVIDFGISRALDGTSVTATGMVVGTPGYMSPEQAEGVQAGPEGDVFSLGCVLAYAATGNAPFGGGSAASVLYRVVRSQPDLTGVPDRLRGVIAACLAKDPAQRPGLAALGAMIAQASPAITATPTSFWPEPVAEIIRTAQGLPTQVGPAAGSPAQPGMAPLSMAQPGFAQPGADQPGWTQSAQPWQGPSGWAQGGPGQGGGQTPGGPASGGSPGQGSPVHASPLQDGYLAAATASMTRNPGAPGGPGAPGTGSPTYRMTPGQGSSWPAAAPGSWPGASGTDPMSKYTPAPRRPRPPTSVLAAGWLMYAGAALSLIHILVLLAIIGGVKSAFIKKHPLVSAHTAQSLAGVASLEVLVVGAIVIALWLWLAAASKAGHGWVRTVGTVLFGVATFCELAVLHIPGISGVGAVIWLIGLVTVILLWQRKSGEFFSLRR